MVKLYTHEHTLRALTLAENRPMWLKGFKEVSIIDLNWITFDFTIKMSRKSFQTKRRQKIKINPR